MIKEYLSLEERKALSNLIDAVGLLGVTTDGAVLWLYNNNITMSLQGLSLRDWGICVGAKEDITL